MINNYKKCLLSLAAIMAMSPAINAAQDYLPLATKAKDYRWVMFGVDGFVGGSQTASFDLAGTEGSDTTVTDEVGTDIFMVAANQYLGNIKALPGLSGASSLTTLKVNMNISNIAYVETEPMRTMYMQLPSSNGSATEPNVLFTYKSSLEGKSIELQNSDNTITYTTVISALSTFDSPVEPSIKTIGSESNASVAITDSIDYNFANNPGDSSRYTRTPHQDDITTSNVRVYSYDAPTKAWKIFDTKNDASANDFSVLDKGVGYWGRLDDGGDTDTNSKSLPAGIVLGNGALADTDYDDNNLSEGWNLMSFSSLKPDIINSTTGILLTTPNAATVSTGYTIFDSTGENNVTATIDVGNTLVAQAKTINLAIESAKAKGNFSDSFDLRAFAATGNTQLVFLSNKRFYFETNTTTDTTAIASINSENSTIWNVATNAYIAAADPVANAKYGSKYGEYSLAFRPMLTATSAAHLENNASVTGDGAQYPVAIQVNEDTTNLIYLGANGGVGAIATAASNAGTAISKQDSIDGTSEGAKASAIIVDINNSGSDNIIIATSDTPFYLRDHTFIRVYDYTGAASTHKLVGGVNDADILPAGATTASIETKINATADDDTGSPTGVYADVDSDTLILVSSTKDTNNFDLRDNSADKLQDTTTSHDAAKGAVSDVFHLDTLAKTEVYPYKWVVQIADETTFNNIDSNMTNICTVNIAVDDNTTYGADINVSNVSHATNGDATKLTYLDALVSAMHTNVLAQGNDVNAYHDFNSSNPGYPISITMESYTHKVFGINFGATANVTCNQAAVASTSPKENGADSNLNVNGNLITTTGDATQDLKFNAVSTKSYAQAGPLYTMKDQGYTIKSIISGNTNLTSGVIKWDSIDLTRTAQEMFTSQNFNLFNIDGKFGYWVYLAENEATDLNDLVVAASGSTLVEETRHHFDKLNVIARNHIATDLTVSVTGLTVPATGVASTERVWASIGGTSVELTGDPEQGQYTASINSYDISMPSANVDVTVSVSDGEGWLLASQSVGTIDNEKPTKPVIDLTDGFSVDSTSTDVVGYYVFKTEITEEVMHSADPTTSSNYIGYVLDGATTIDFCSSSAITFDNSIAILSVAVDGGGKFKTGNISDVASATYYAIMKGSNHYSHLGLGADADIYGLAYADTCSPAAAENTVDNGIALKSITTGVVAKLAVAPISGVTFALDIPYTIYIGDGTNVAEVKIAPSYLGKPFYIQFDGQVYSGTFPTTATGTTGITAYDTFGEVAVLTGASPKLGGATITGQSF